MSDAAIALEIDIRDIKATLGRLEPLLARMDERINGMNARMDHMTATMATKEDLARVEGALPRLDDRMNNMNERMASKEDLARLEGALRVEIADVRADLLTKPSRAGMWGMAITLIGLVVASIGAGATFLPLLSRVLH